ncbi:CDP-diacylglycerol--glycerol-3-phosphate 3-phosphatidyltransferase [Nitrosomonas oligotropha]|uniref:CDP-diacylglycerol--glycerol-3-phosphate 3-phosphatidyltransferase n=1 Tax=Nitrosomonas oligotropha TaxID=42354 RepID=A0A1H8KCA4_9PROT|nr:CDP-diacylglycerol--glycerol-3-phosphate 3-phosphatidyltransferase [Nitrosomonas oligotropha]SDW30055.1 CDP-diacylglycerol--glycerol-3-phosphate 3-phosphatidyltransferase [Nitrosomonas oligotropha]SEN90610.1 CDP-diacylglycerol--glycerol-3-phosphate 3-phosphatidyltransferase [Nitrosomonas oligotropha]
MPFNLPNILTWLRILAIPLFVGIFYLPHDWLSPTQQNLVATLIFAGAAITDWLDGYLARVLNQTSAFGAFLDPVADKLMVCAALIVLVYLERLDAPIAFVIIGREITVSALREWMAQIGQSKSVAVSFLGKIKTTSQMIAIPLLLYHEKIGEHFDPQQVGTWFIYIAAVLTLWSMFYYLKAAVPKVLEDETKRS